MKMAKDLECGHFISRRHMSVRFDERNAMPQSTYENLTRIGVKKVGTQQMDMRTEVIECPLYSI